MNCFDVQALMQLSRSMSWPHRDAHNALNQNKHNPLPRSSTSSLAKLLTPSHLTICTNTQIHPGRDLFLSSFKQYLSSSFVLE